MEACRALGKGFSPILAIDNDLSAVQVYRKNFTPQILLEKGISEVLNGETGRKPTSTESKLLTQVGPVELLLAGPPCQGYSSLNNYSRQNDDRNSLYGKAARFIEIFLPKYVLIENVPSVIHSKENVVEQTLKTMSEVGYHVDEGIIDLSIIGVPQKRKRHIIIASIIKPVSIHDIMDANEVERERTVEWAIADLADERPTSSFNKPTVHSKANMDRIVYLHSHQEYDLPDSLRPDCHKLKKHAYKSMYGRLKPLEPAQTITTGFMSPGQGRYVHPTKRRAITAHEAARFQFFPDFFDFTDSLNRGSLSRLIGNAVPMKLSYIFCLNLLSQI
ncbi:DNA cytosine methyltransferase [Candidatus Bathyarchaeota archaeon]|nr:DNA cytosine methyltransferase [Candidatus Bathyarchaeota archaeon]